MQPAPSEASQNTTPVNQVPNLPSSPQHGLSSVPEEASGRLLTGEDGREPSPPPDSADTASVASRRARRGRPKDIRRISSRSGSSEEGSPGSRIEEYEKLHASTTKKSGGLAFQVVPIAKDKSSCVSIEDFPNEVLTHVLSHLTPETLSSMSLVSRRFHKLITTPHAWRIAFARYFPGSDNAEFIPYLLQSAHEPLEQHFSERRTFSRLSALASWRSEYILRTRLLRSLGRGRPALQGVARPGLTRHGGTSATAVVTFGSGLLYPVSHIHGIFGIGLNKKQPVFVHGAVEQGIASISDPSTGKIGNWGLGDFEGFKHFADLFIGEVEYGLGPGNVVGMPNVMDVSKPYGKIYGEACPGGRVFFTSATEQRGRFLSITSAPLHESGIPDVTMIGCSVCSIWIAKTEAVLKATNGIVGLLAGFSNGVLAAYALGVNPVQDRRFAKGEPTAKWVLSPGVPITAICIDEKISTRRQALNRVWAVVLNALGEVFCLTDVPTRPDFKGRLNETEIDQLAWQTGRTVEWSLIESTRRTAKPDPFNTALVDGSYTPHTSSLAMGLSRDQIMAETKEIEKYLLQKPKYFQSICEGWDMRRKLAADFSGDDRHGAGESIFVLAFGLDEGKLTPIRRFTRRKTKTAIDFDLEPYPKIQSSSMGVSLFGNSVLGSESQSFSTASPQSMPRSRTSSRDGSVDASFKVDWHLSNLSFGDLRGLQISAVATDDSDFATLTSFEDPLLGMSGGSNSSSPLSSPLGQTTFASSSSEIPGHRARFLAVGTTSGIVLLWDMRAAPSKDSDIVNTIAPVRIVYTKSPQISSLALSSLYLVHGGNDGLVQAWDPLASTTEPLRTLNSRFSDRARRRIAQAEASQHGVGNNYYAAGAIVLDPDPTVLRGMVSLGTHLRYWSYSSSAADAYKSRKRGQLRRRSERGSNTADGGQRYTHTGRGVLRDYIANEKQDLEREKIAKSKEDERLSGRFGVDLLGAGANDEEILAYATMLSEESWTSDEVKRRGSEENSAIVSSRSSETVHEPGSLGVGHDEALDPDLEEAIRLSLLEREQAESPPSALEEFQVPIRFAKSSRHSTPSKTVPGVGASGSSSSKGPTTTEEQNELEFALQLSLAEEQSRLMAGGEGEVGAHGGDNDFPSLPSPPASDEGAGGSGSGKGKGRRRRKG